MNHKYPVYGTAVAALLRQSARSSNDIWVVRSIETLSDMPSLSLGNLWARVTEAPVEIETNALCSALDQAFQVVTLDVECKADPAKRLVVDDGEMIVVEL
jgi:hypothetical protein